jgi:uncharacterized protein YraI
MKILTATALLLAIALPATAQVGPAYVSQNSNYGTVCTVERGSSLSVRSGSGKNYRVLTQVRDGNGIAVNSGQQGRDGFRWLSASANGRQGWVRADYICGMNN